MQYQEKRDADNRKRRQASLFTMEDEREMIRAALIRNQEKAAAALKKQKKGRC